MKKSIFVSICLLLAIPCYARIIYVDVNTPDNNDGSSWDNAYKYLQDALDEAVSGDEIWVAQGTYKPTKEVGGTGDRYKTFQMKKGVDIYGGLEGNEPNTFDIDLRDFNDNETILSGDLLANDVPALDPWDLYCDPCREDNCYHVFYHPEGVNLDPTAIIDGFTITAGNANGSDWLHKGGGGMYNKSSNPIITNCIFSDNSADQGGGIYNESSPIVSNCTFISNLGYYRGGGMLNIRGVSPATNSKFTENSTNSGNAGDINNNCNTIVINCLFSNNGAYEGGGICSLASSSKITFCKFSDNWAYFGGGMHNECSIPILLSNSTFNGNWAYEGGGIYSIDSNLTVTNCIFTDNSANVGNGGGTFILGRSLTFTGCTLTSNSANNNGGGMYNECISAAVSNCILWDNTATNAGPQIYTYTHYPLLTTVSYSDVQGGWDGTGNINQDPCFVDADGADDIIGTEDDNLRLLASSPCIDAGDNSLVPADSNDLDGNPRIVNEIIDMGAYEFQLLDPVELLFDLTDQVIDLNLPKGTANSLLSKLDNALKLLEDENEKNDIAAINVLEAFINAVEAQRGKKISEPDADALIAAGEQIIVLLSTE